METIDARGLDCPGPVVETKKLIESKSPEAVSVIVDNDAARQNVERFLASQGFSTKTAIQGADMIVTGTREAATACGSPIAAKRHEGTPTMVMITADRIGRGDDELGGKLAVNFIKTLGEMGDDLWRLVFLNSGVKLATEGSPVIAELAEYEKNGLQILVCGTCLSHFGLLDKKKVGQTTNMLDIVSAMQLAAKVIVI